MPIDEAGDGGQAELLGAPSMGDDADRGAVVLAGGVAGGHRRLRILADHHRTQGGEALQRGVGARVLVAVDQAGAVLAVLDLDGHDLLREGAVLLGGHRALVGAQRERVLLLARDRVVAPEVLGRLDHSSGYRMVDAAGGHPAAHEAVLEHRAARAGSPAQPDRIQLGLAHRLRAAGENDVGDSGLHLHGGVEDGLQSRAAAAVDLKAGDVDRHPGVEGGDAPERGCLAVGVPLAEDDVVDGLGRQLGARHHLLDHGRRQLGDGHVTEDAAEPAHRGPEGFADERIGHGPGSLALRTCRARVRATDRRAGDERGGQGTHGSASLCP
jgi:hypothetical protein